MDMHQEMPPNPKQQYGDRKAPLGLFPSAGLIYGTLAFAEGAAKYGPYNWRDKAVEAMTYVHAAERHLRAWIDREDNAPDSGLPHIGHAIACLAILADATEQGNLIDNRPLAGSAARLLDQWKRLDDEVLTSTFGPKEDYAVPPPPTPLYGENQPGGHGYQPGPIVRVDRINGDDDKATVNGADVIGMNRKVSCVCQNGRCLVEQGGEIKYAYCKADVIGMNRKVPCVCQNGRCLVEQGGEIKYAYCKKAEEADRVPNEVYAKVCNHHRLTQRCYVCDPEAERIVPRY